MTLSHGSYTVAWICALPVELAATKAILDEIHPALPQPRSDHNVYTLGKVSGHNVVIACLPAGVYGTTAATAAVSHLRSTYQNVRFALMVGIGGGVPSEKSDISLGDVVVSKPTHTSNGVIQYDYGKTLQDGRLHRTGLLNRPPSLLLKVLAQIESDSILEESTIGNIMASIKEEVQNQFSRPSMDQLFQSTYNHISNESTCSRCDQSQLVNRPERAVEQPHVHYGLIASGNQVMKDAKTRDSIAQDQEILCFEMEAAGLMDEIPSLVIRGICDYCDSHKHKEWQPYAALVAAVYAKARLMRVPQELSAGLNSIPSSRHWMVPFHRNRGFVGREGEIVKIEQLIQMGQPKVAICGLGGMGKTQIAIELAYRRRERDLNCSIFWIPCTSYARVEQAYMDIAQAVGIQGIKPVELKDRLKNYFSRTGGQPWLLIFDNADDMDMWFNGDSEATALAALLPQNEQGCILFTTRNRKLAVNLTSAAVVNVSEPDAETGVKILENALINQDLLLDKEATINLLEQLVFLPLAITQAAAYINSNDIELRDYIGLLQEQEPDVIELLSENFEDQGRYKETLNPVATTWLISFRQIQQLDSLAADYLSFMACINPRDIPQSLLPEAASKKKRIDAVGLLKAFSFVTEQVKNHALSLHRLVYLSTRSWLSKEGQFGLHIQKAADHLNQVFPDNNHENRRKWREYMPHALSLIGEEIFKAERGRYINLIENIGNCLQMDGRYSEAIVLYEDILKLQQIGEVEIGSLARSMADLGRAYSEQGRLKEAAELEEEALEIRTQALGPRHPDTLSSMNNLACTYRDQGQLEQAEKLEEQVLEMRKQLLGPQHPDTLESIANLACIYWDQGLWKQAEELEEQVLEMRKQLLGPQHPDTLRTMANLACTYRGQGQLEKAEKLEEQVLEIRKQVLGPQHPETVTSMANLAHTYWDQGQWIQAGKLEEQVLEIHKQVLGPQHPDTLTSMANLAHTYWDQGQWIQAEKLEEQVLEIRKQVLGPKNPLTLRCMHNLAYTWRDQGKVVDAVALMEECLELRNRLLGPSHPESISSAQSLAAWNEEFISTPDEKPSSVSVTGFLGEDEKRDIIHQQRERATTPVQLFLERHPLLMASRSASLGPSAYDLHDVD